MSYFDSLSILADQKQKPKNNNKKNIWENKQLFQLNSHKFDPKWQIMKINKVEPGCMLWNPTNLILSLI